MSSESHLIQGRDGGHEDGMDIDSPLHAVSTVEDSASRPSSPNRQLERRFRRPWLPPLSSTDPTPDRQPIRPPSFHETSVGSPVDRYPHEYSSQPPLRARSPERHEQNFERRAPERRYSQDDPYTAGPSRERRHDERDQYYGRADESYHRHPEDRRRESYYPPEPHRSHGPHSQDPGYPEYGRPITPEYGYRQFYPGRDSRDRSPRSRGYSNYVPGHQPTTRDDPREYREERGSRREREYGQESSYYYGRPSTPDYHARPLSAEEYMARADTYERRSNRYVPPHYHDRLDRERPFTFAHRGERRPDSQERPTQDERGERISLPPVARELLSASPEAIQVPPRHIRDPIERARSVGSRTSRHYPHSSSHRPYEQDLQVERGASPTAPEAILEGMRYRQPQRGHGPYESVPRRTYPSNSERYQEITSHPRNVPATTLPQRPSFPNSGLRSTAPSTPPNPRTLPNDPLVQFPPRFPGPSLAPLPPVPLRPALSHSQPTMSTSSRPHIERSMTQPDRRSRAPSPERPSQNRRSISRTILHSTQYEDPPKPSQHSTASGISPQNNVIRRAPFTHLQIQSLPRLVPTTNLPRTSARICLRPPPERDELPQRTKEQDQRFAEWLFDSSSNVQRCMTRAVMYAQEGDLLRSADELLVSTHWTVKYLHQLGITPSERADVGLSYYSQSRHEMRVAFWWKLNWSWFCLIQSSFDEAKKEIQPNEIQPFPDNQAIRTLSATEMEFSGSSQSSSVKKEKSPSPTPKSSDPETVSEPMEEIQSSMPSIPNRLKEYWHLAKKLNRRPGWPTRLAENEWLEIGDVLVELGCELAKYGLLDMDLGMWENEIMHRIIAVTDAWRRREMEVLRQCNAEFRKLGVEEQKIMVAALKDDDQRAMERRQRI